MSDSAESQWDVYIGCKDNRGLSNNLWQGNDFSVTFLQTTLVDVVLRKTEAVASVFHSKVLCEFEKLQKIPNHDGPKFVFAHLLGPHPSYLFAAGGGLVKPEANFLG